jgi:hypothetical protein
MATGSFFSSPLLTMASIAAVAGITAGLLVLAGVGDGESRSQREAQLREEQINQIAERFVADIVRESPSFCDVVTNQSSLRGNGGFSDVAISGDPSDANPLSAEDLRILSDRISEKLEAQCGERSR